MSYNSPSPDSGVDYLWVSILFALFVIKIELGIAIHHHNLVGKAGHVSLKGLKSI
jgi:hypothetical protein